MNPLALVGIACLLANEPNIDKTKATQGLTNAELSYVQSIDTSTACYEDDLRKKLEQTSSETASGHHPGMSVEGCQRTLETGSAM